MKNLSKEKTQRLILLSVGTLILTVAIWFLLISAQNKRLADIARQATEQENKVASAQRLVASVPDIQKGLAAATGRLRAIEEGMASGDMYSWIILKVNRFKADHKVDINQFSREVTTDVGMFAQFPYKAVLFHVRGTADYHDLGKFLASFENSFPFMRVQNLELNPTGSSAATATTTATGAEEAEKLAFKLEIVALIKPNAP